MTTKSSVGTYKVSSLGWLCKEVEGKWIPMTKLTEQQVVDLK